ncbi:hypothetical protein D3C76_545790 [compost metagenome]
MPFYLLILLVTTEERVKWKMYTAFVQIEEFFYELICFIDWGNHKGGILWQIMRYQIIKGDVVVDFNSFCDNAAICKEDMIEDGFDTRSYQVNDTEVALNEIRSFSRSSIEQLKNGKKVIFIGATGGPQKEFSDLDSFKDWLNHFAVYPNISLSRHEWSTKCLALKRNELQSRR